ncbi:hypothetical protein DBR06_SOUSAS4110195 [Sousa chinensis]|nr:hypothetical protein DBR06_SOUSAS4110195 [Sousa chinensis]
MGQLSHVHYPLPAQHLGHALAPPIRQQGPTRAQWSRWGSYGQQLGNRPPVLRQRERTAEVSPCLFRRSSAPGPGISWQVKKFTSIFKDSVFYMWVSDTMS